MAALIEFRDVSKTFTTGSTEVKALQSITLDIDAGDIFAIIGGSGAGKCTLVRLINALESATSTPDLRSDVRSFGVDLDHMEPPGGRPPGRSPGAWTEEDSLAHPRSSVKPYGCGSAAVTTPRRGG